MSQLNPVISLLFQLNFFLHSFPLNIRINQKCIFNSKRTSERTNKEKKTYFNSLCCTTMQRLICSDATNTRGNSIARRRMRWRWKVHFTGLLYRKNQKRVHQLIRCQWTFFCSRLFLYLSQHLARSLSTATFLHSFNGSVFCLLFSIFQRAASLDGLIFSVGSIFIWAISHGMAL